MTTALILTITTALGALTVASVAGLVYLAHHLPSSAPHSDETWGTAGDPWVASDPLPFRQLASHESARGLQRAA